ncbi:hypothetical protein IW138_006585, partial [Coemansia sp. RSA 986]
KNKGRVQRTQRWAGFQKRQHACAQAQAVAGSATEPRTRTAEHRRREAPSGGTAAAPWRPCFLCRVVCEPPSAKKQLRASRSLARSFVSVL